MTNSYRTQEKLRDAYQRYSGAVVDLTDLELEVAEREAREKPTPLQLFAAKFGEAAKKNRN